MIFLGDVPWVPVTNVSPGEGTEFPVDLGTHGGWEVYWKAKAFRLAGTVVLSDPPVTVTWSGETGEPRAARARDLVLNQGAGGSVTVTGEGDAAGGTLNWAVSLTFSLVPESVKEAGPASRGHWLRMKVEGTATVTGSGVDREATISTVALPNGVEIGTVTFFGVAVPLYAGATGDSLPEGEFVGSGAVGIDYVEWGEGEL